MKQSDVFNLESEPEFCSLDHVTNMAQMGADPFDIISKREEAAGLPIISFDDGWHSEVTTVINNQPSTHVVNQTSENQEMNLNSIIVEKSHGFTAAGNILVSASNFCKFRIKRHIFNSLKKPETATFDDSVLASMGLLPNQVEGTDRDNGQEKPHEVDIDQIVSAYAAIFTMQARHALTPDPETGKRDPWVQKTLSNLDTLVADMADWSAANSTEANDARAECAKVGVSPDARLAAIRKSNEAKFGMAVQPLRVQYEAAFNTFKRQDDSELVGVVEDALTDEGENVQKWIVECAKRNIDVLRKRATEGKYFKVDNGMYALSQLTV